jgi:hypothetical protein
MDSSQALLQQKLDSMSDSLNSLLQAARFALLISPSDEFYGSIYRVARIADEIELNLHGDAMSSDARDVGPNALLYLTHGLAAPRHAARRRAYPNGGASFDSKSTSTANHVSGRRTPAHFAVGITNSAPFAIVSGQRCITLFCLV